VALGSLPRLVPSNPRGGVVSVHGEYGAPAAVTARIVDTGTHDEALVRAVNLVLDLGPGVRTYNAVVVSLVQLTSNAKVIRVPLRV
jgi:hypothetical protein